MSVSAYRAFEYGRKSAWSLAEALKKVLCCPEDEECNDTIATLAPWLAGIEDCDMLEEALRPYFGWLSIRWGHTPCGEKPSIKKKAVLAALCNAKVPVPEEVFTEAEGSMPPEGGGFE